MSAEIACIVEPGGPRQVERVKYEQRNRKHQAVLKGVMLPIAFSKKPVERHQAENDRDELLRAVNDRKLPIGRRQGKEGEEQETDQGPGVHDKVDAIRRYAGGRS